MAFARTFFHEPAHVGQKAHVQHPVGFVEHEKFHLVQLQRALFEMIEQTSGRGDHDVRAGAQFVGLPAVADAAINHGDFQIREARVIAHGRLDLRREFARRFQDERARAGGIVLAEFGKNGQAERGGFAGAGLRAADDVLAGKHQRDGAELNGRRIHITHRLDAVQNDGRKT